MNKNIYDFFRKGILITIGAIIYAISVSMFLNPNNLAPGGVSGLAIVLKAALPILPGVGVLIIVLNIPIMILGIYKFGLKFAMSTLYTLIVSSVLIDIIPTITKVKSVTDDSMLAAIIGGGLLGVAMGGLFRLETTTGGFDIIIKVIRQKVPHLKSGTIFILLDVVVLGASALVFGNVEVALYAAIAIYASSLVMDKVLYGSDEATLVYIISEKRKEIAKYMLEDMDVGVTMVQGKGAYTGKDTEMIMCVMRKRQMIKTKHIIKKMDKNAFMIVSSASEVFGEGFKDPMKNEI